MCVDYELSSMQGAPGDGDLMLICIAPDKEGKFGFNVKVGLCLLFTTHTQEFYVYYCCTLPRFNFLMPPPVRVALIRRCL